MIDIKRLYEIAPQIAPKNYKTSIRKRPLSSSYKASALNCSSIENPFRYKLLQNLQTFRYNKSSNYQDRFYTCSSKQSISTFRVSVNSSLLPSYHLGGPDFSLDIYNKKNPKQELMESDLKSSLITENKTYQRQISGRLKSTMPKFLESSRKKALRKITFVNK
jgi:hypothetical protein